MPEFGGFGENNAGFTGMFEVKKKARREQQDELEFPEPMEPVQEEKKKKKKPQEGKGKKKKKVTTCSASVKHRNQQSACILQLRPGSCKGQFPLQITVILGTLGGTLG